MLAPAYIFRDRRDAGRALAAALRVHVHGPSALILGLPRGGIPVAFEVADALGVPLDVFTVRKLGTPGHEELAMGAIATGGGCVLDDTTIATFEVSPGAIERVRHAEEADLVRRERCFRGDRPPVTATGSDVIVVDDGMATGATMRAAVMALRLQRPRTIVVAVPIASDEACAALTASADRCVCLATPEPFISVSHWYRKFPQIEDTEVRSLLEMSSVHLPEAAAAACPHQTH